MRTKIDLISGVILIVFVAYGLNLAFKLDTTSTTIYGPDFFPKLVLSTLGIFLIILIINAFKNMKYSRNKSEAENAGEGGVDYKILRRILLLIILMISYVIAFVYFGFFIPTVLFLIMAEIIFGVKKIYIIILSSILSPALMYLFFVNLFNIPLP